MRAHNIDRLRYYLGCYPWHLLYGYNDIEELYSHFLSIVKHIVTETIPVRSVRLGTNDPVFVTPMVKLLLKRRNKLRRKGRIIDSDELAQKINSLINENRSTSLSKLNNSNVKQLWAAVKHTRGSTGYSNVNPHPLLHDINAVNSHFATVSTKNEYDYHELDRFYDVADNSEFQPITCVEVERLLRSVKLTAAGCDGIPAWLLRSCSVELAEIIARVLNCSFSSGRVPSHWLNSLVTPSSKGCKTRQLI